MKKYQQIIKSKIFRVFLILGTIGFVLIGILLIISGKKILRIEENIDFGDYTLCVRDYGKGEPTVIIEAGLACSKQLYYNIQYRTSRMTRVIAYDHAGIGESTASPNPRTLPYYVEELRLLMKKKNLSPPFILVGHSLGGHIIRYYAYLYPEEIAGLIFIDHPHEDWFRYIRKTWSKEEQDEYFKFWDPIENINGYTGAGYDEMIKYEDNCDSLRGKEIDPDIPVLMFTGKNRRHFRQTEPGMSEDMKAWAGLQHSLIENVKHAKQIVDEEAGHSLHKDKPLMVQREINAFIKQCREIYNSKNK